MTEDDEIDELREQTRGTDRISAEVTDGEEEASEERTEKESEAENVHEGPKPSDSFGDALADRLNRTRAGVDPSTFSADDPGLSALLLALQDTGEIEDVGGELRDLLGAPEPPKYDRDAVLRLALTYALRETAPEYFEELAENA